MEQLEKPVKQSAKRSSFPRDPRGSLEVFNPSSYSTDNPSDSPFQSQPKWKTWVEPPTTNKDEITSTSWMALKDSDSPPPPTLSAILNERPELTLKSPSAVNFAGDVGTAAQRVAEWGLVLKTDMETRKPKGVAIRNSGGEEPNAKITSTSRRNSNNSMRRTLVAVNDAVQIGYF
ncbi:hypothetical protein QN277_028343 [Acacia crassicarpa]|uniref:Uncharacterized protein n=1 Tax=Acacia crassicarpa TaxID=499986 RepID=A0AAE1MI67_9FABA|nr:hypothetical protein QN277_028343 [Acacia crassicarpa]